MEHERVLLVKISNTNEHEHTVFEKMLNTNEHEHGFFEKIEHERTRTRVLLKLLNTANTNKHEQPFIFIPDWCATLTIFLRKNLEILEPS